MTVEKNTLNININYAAELRQEKGVFIKRYKY